MNRVALITGASRGIGRGIALAVARLGYDVVINYFNRDDLAQQAADECRQVAQSAGHAITTHLCRADIADTDDRARLVSWMRHATGRIDLLVNNAGVAPEVRTDLLEATEASFDRLLQINAKGPYFLTQAVARWMIAQQADAPLTPVAAPKIVTISSISAYTASVHRGDYCVSKAALSMLTPLFAARLAEHGIGVYELRPGLITTDMTESVRGKYDALIRQGLTPIARWGTPDDVGRAVVALVEDRFPFSTGDVFNIDGGFHLRRL